MKAARFLAILLLAPLFLWLHPAHAQNPYVEYRARTYAIQEAYLKRVTEHQVRVMEDFEKKLEQQKWQTTVVSIMVVVMVGCGVALSALQFYSDFRSRGQSSMTLKIGSGSFELSSTVIGLVILAMSFWFFQTYIDRVYAINITTLQPLDVTTFGLNG